jgi:hypothetical protein
MSTVMLSTHSELGSAADAALKAAVRLWFVVAVAGQLIFVYYIAAFYGGTAVRGDFQAWNKVLVQGYAVGQTIRNIALSSHLALAALITFCGALQLIPQVRARFPRVHGWIGRVYIPIAFLMAGSALYLILSGRKLRMDVTQHVALGINALLIMLCAAMAARYAIARDFDAHRRWALRLFLVVSGQWFLRVGLMLWVFLDGTAAEFDPRTFQGPILSFLSFLQYLVPLAVLELYLRAQDRAGALGRLAMAVTLFVLTTAMGVGIVSATLRMWLPRI